MRNHRRYIFVCSVIFSIFSMHACAMDGGDDPRRSSRSHRRRRRRGRRRRGMARLSVSLAQQRMLFDYEKRKQEIVEFLAIVSSKIPVLQRLCREFDYNSTEYNGVIECVGRFKAKLNELSDGHWVKSGRLSDRKYVPGIKNLLADDHTDFGPFHIALTHLLQDITAKVVHFKKLKAAQSEDQSKPTQ